MELKKGPWETAALFVSLNRFISPNKLNTISEFQTKDGLMTKKPMNKVLKFFLWTGGIVVGLFVLFLAAAAIIVPIVLPPDKLKSMATQKLSETLKHKVTIGDVHFNVLSGFEIQDLVIANRAGWDDKPLVSAKDISISYHLFPLLWGQVSLGEIKLNQPEILVERRGLNSFNFSDMMGASVAEAASAPTLAPKGKSKAKNKKKSHVELLKPVKAPTTPWYFADQVWADTIPTTASKPSNSTMLVSVDNLNITQANLIYLDETVSPPQRSDAQDLNLKIQNISLVGGKISYLLDAPFNYNKMPYKVSMSGSLHYFLSGQSIKGLNLQGTVNDLGFKLSGDALDMADNFTPNMDGEASLDMLKFAGLVPRSLSSMPEGLSLTGPAKVDFHLGGTAKGGLELTGKADGSDLAIQYKDLFVKTAKTTCTVDFKSVIGPGNSYDLPSFKAVYQDWEVTGAFHHKNGVPWTCEVHSQSLPFKGLSGMIPKLKNTRIDGDGSLDLSFSQTSGDLPFNADGKVVLKGIGITLSQEPYLQDMNGTILITDNVIRIPAVTSSTFDGTEAMGVTVNFKTQAYAYNFNLKNVNAQKVVNASVDAYVTQNPQEDKDKLYGTMNLVYAGAGKGFSSDSMMTSATGSGNYSLVKAQVKGIAAIKTINNFFKDKSDEINFDQIAGTLAMKNKVISYTANTTGKAGAIREAGGINVVEMVYSPDMKVQCDIHKDLLDSDAIKGQIPAPYRDKFDLSLVADANGNVPIDFRFTGSVKKTPGMDCVDTNRMIKNLMGNLGKVLQKALQTQGQNAVQNLGNQLKGLFH